MTKLPSPLPRARVATAALTLLGHLRLLGFLICAGAFAPLMTHAAPGDLDTAGFGAGFGKVITAMSLGDDRAAAISLQPDGKILVAGACDVNTFYAFCLARYTASGSLDTSFNATGKVLSVLFSTSDFGNALALQPDGKIVVAGNCRNSTNNDFCLARYTTSGSLDTTFNSTGKVITPIGSSDDFVSALALQPDGKIVVAGACNDSFNSPNYDFCLARYTASGSLDTTFNSTGKVITAIGVGRDIANAIALQPDGRIVVAGGCSNGTNNDFCLARYTTSGALDTSFSADGKVITPIGSGNDVATAMALQPDGKIIVAGTCSNGTNDDFCLARYTTSGSLDGTFNSTGNVITAIGSGKDEARAMTLQPDGRIVVAGGCFNGSNNDFCLARYTTSGSLDTSFSVDGKVTTDVGVSSSFDTATAIALQPDGKIVLAGLCGDSSGLNNDFCLARYEGGPFDAQNCKLDIDGDNRVLATTDALIHARIALGITGPAVINGITFAANATRNTWPLIRDYLVTQCGMSLVQ